MEEAVCYFKELEGSTKKYLKYSQSKKYLDKNVIVDIVLEENLSEKELENGIFIPKN